MLGGWLAGAALASCEAPAPPVVREPVARPEATTIVYPVELWDQGVEGETLLLVFVGATGAVDTARVHRTSGYAQFDSAAIGSAREMRFTPAQRGEERIGMWVRVPVRFTMERGAVVAPAGEP